jgi:hypothetical protein
MSSIDEDCVSCIVGDNVPNPKHLSLIVPIFGLDLCGNEDQDERPEKKTPLRKSHLLLIVCAPATSLCWGEVYYFGLLDQFDA